MKKTSLILIVSFLFFSSTQLSATIYFDDGQHHFINETINENVVVRDSGFWGEPTTVHFMPEAFLADGLSVYGNSRVEIVHGYIYGTVIADNNSLIDFGDAIIGQDIYFKGQSRGMLSNDGYIRNLYALDNSRIYIEDTQIDR